MFPVCWPRAGGAAGRVPLPPDAHCSSSLSARARGVRPRNGRPQVLSDIKVQSLPRGSEEVGFGKVITSPLAPDRPLTVVQPQVGRGGRCGVAVTWGSRRCSSMVTAGREVRCGGHAGR